MQADPSTNKPSKSVQKKVRVKYSKQLDENKDGVKITVLYHGMKQIVHIVSDIPTPSMFLPGDFKSYIKISLCLKNISIPNFPSAYKLKVYLPLIFKSLRSRFNVTEEQFEECFLMDPQPSKNSANSYKSSNKTFDLKFLESNDISQFLQIIRPYYEHVVINRNSTYLPKYVGLFRIRKNKKNTYVLIMKNSTHMNNCATTSRHIYTFSNKTMNSTNSIEKSKTFELDEKRREVTLKRLQKDIEFLSNYSIRRFTLYAKSYKPLSSPDAELGLNESRRSKSSFSEDSGNNIILKNSDFLCITIRDFSTDIGTAKAASNKLVTSGNVKDSSDEHSKSHKHLNVDRCLHIISHTLVSNK